MAPVYPGDRLPDLALALHLGLLAPPLGATVVIPLGDLALVQCAGPDPLLPYLLLHGTSGLALALLARFVGKS